jgi:Domain of unknown function (DU1801)
MTEDEARFESFLAHYLPVIAAVGRAAVKRLRARLPGCDILIYDNFSALAAGFSPDGRTRSAFISVALYPRWVSLFFLQGADLPDPENLLKGSGAVVRHLVLQKANDLDLPAIRSLIDAALLQSKIPYDPKREGRTVIKSVSAKQRPRRPA